MDNPRRQTLLLLCLALGAGAASVPIDGVRADATPAPVTIVLSVQQRRLADQIISIFENGTPELQYGYAEKLGDGRGITAGRAGFTSGTGDLLEVIERYIELQPDTGFKALLPTLERRARYWSGSTRKLGKLPAMWQALGDDPLFRQAQDEIVDRMYFQRAQRYAREAGATRPLTLLLLYDAVIQHGFGSDDPDGLPAMLRKTCRAVGGTPSTGVDEAQWAQEFLRIRRKVLSRAHSFATRRVWAESVPRVDALQQLVDANEWELHSPVTLQPWGPTFTVDGSTP